MKNYVKELDVCSGIAIIFVVLLHASALYLGNILNLTGYYKTGYFLVAVNKIIYIAVPIFIFVAGFKYQINKKERYATYIKKRLLKVLVPFLFISITFISINSIYSYIFKGEALLSIFRTILIDTIKIFLGSNFVYPLWYVPMYLLIVLTYPLITIYINNQKMRFIIFSFISIIYTILANFTNVFHGYKNPFCFPYYFIFFEIGCYASKNKLNKIQQHKLFVSYLIILVASVFTAESKYNSIITNLILSPIAVCAFYYFSVYLKESNILTTIGKYSFYVFLFHEPIFVTYLTKLFNYLNLYTGYYITLVITILSILLSIGTYKILEKIGVSKFIFSEKKRTENSLNVSSGIKVNQ